MLTIERYRTTRFWALYEAGQLLCVTVYKKGAWAVRERIERGAPIVASRPRAPLPSQSAPSRGARRPPSAARR